jgi:hypothetical protein
MDKPEKCPLSYDPYTFCPIKFTCEDDMILEYVSAAVSDTKRFNGLSMSINSEDAISIDRWAGTITAYMNGRIRQALERQNEKTASGYGPDGETMVGQETPETAK